MVVDEEQEIDHSETGEALVELAKSLRPQLEVAASLHEELGELSPETVTLLDDAGFFKMAAPRRVGGLSVPSFTMARVALELAKGCPSAAWVVTVINSNVWLASTAPIAVQRKIFSSGIPLSGVPRIVGPGFGRGTLERRNGKFVVNGTWGYGSGSHHAHWAIVYAVDESGDLNRVAIPMSELRIDNTWVVAGMRATGSDTVVADDVFVDDDQFYQIRTAGTNTAMVDEEYEREFTDYWAFPVIRAKAFGVFVGCAEALMEHVLTLKDRPVPHSLIAKRGESEVWQMRLGEAASHIQLARTIMDAHGRLNDACAHEHRVMTYEERVALRGECAAVTELLIGTVEKLMDLAGASAYALKSPAQRFWRDFSISIRHGVFNPELGFEAYGKQLLGIRPNVIVDDLI